MFSYWLLYNYLFPLDYQIVKLFFHMIYSLAFVEGDAEMFSEEHSELDRIVGCSVNNIGYLDDFADVNHIFCDKTGTLTKNELVFNAIGLGANKFEFGANFKSQLNLCSDPKLLDLFRCICLCHDLVKIVDETGSEMLSGTSLDEVCFLEMAEKSGVCNYKDRDQTTIRITVNDKLEEYTLLRMFEFTSDRKKMSVIVRRVSDNKIFSFVKGADNMLIPALADRRSSEESTLSHLEDFAKVGLRTLAFAMKELSENDITSLIDVKDPSPFETGLDLLGVTGIEDRLQDDVKECIIDFRQADCKVWMLTGDKGTTAKAVAISCGLIDESTQKVLKLEDCATVEELDL